MHSLSHFFAFLVLTILLSLSTRAQSDAVNTAEDTKVRSHWMQGYVKIEEAEKADRGGDPQTALALYRQAHAILTKVQREHPEWNPSLLKFRIAHCKDQMKRLESAGNANFANTSRDDLVVLLRENMATVRELSNENKRVKSDFDSLNAELDAAKKTAGRYENSAEQTDELLRENRQLLTRVEVQKERLERLASEVKSLQSSSGVSEARERLKAELNVALARRAELETLLKNMRDDHDLLNQRLNEASQGRREQDERVDTLRGELKREQNRVAERDEHIRQLEDRVSTATAEIPALKETVKRLEATLEDHRMVKDMLTSELMSLREIRDRYNVLMREKTVLQAQLAEARSQGANVDALGDIAATDLPPLPEIPQIDDDMIEQTGRELTRIHAKRVGGTDELTMRRHILNLYRDFARLGLEADYREGLLAREQAKSARLKSHVAELTTSKASLNARLEGVGEQAAASKKFSDLLQSKDKQLQRLQERIERVENTLTERTQELHEVKARLETNQRDKAELETTLATVKAVNDELKAKNDRLERANEIQGDPSAMAVRMRELESRNAELEASLKNMKTRNDDQVRLLRLQEQRLARLTEENQALELTVKGRSSSGTVPANVSINAPSETSAAAVISAAELKAMEQRLKQAVERRKTAQQENEGLQKKLTQQEAEITELRQRLDSERRSDAAAKNQALLAQLSIKTRELERERQRVETMKTALERASLGLPSEARDISLTVEQRQRSRDQKQFVRKLLKDGVSAEKAGNSEAAVWNYKKVLDHDAQNKVALQRLGHLAVQKDHLEDAERYLRRAFYIDPDDRDTLVTLGFVYAKQQRSELAISYLTRAAAMGEANAEIHRQLGVVCVNMGWQDAAEDEFRRALELDKADSSSAFNLAILLAAAEPPRLEEAREWYHTARKLGTDGDPELDAFFKYSQAQ